MNTDGITPINTIAHAALYPIPKNNITNGIQAIGGGKRGASRMKLIMKFLFKKAGKLNLNKPKVIPKTKARLPPHKTRNKLAQQLFKISV